MMTGVMADVQSIDVARVNSLSPFGPTVMEEQGVGLSTEDFAKKQATGHLAGHVGFHESARMIADALGWKLSTFSQWMAPIVTHDDRKSLYGEAKKNHVAGVDMNALAMVDGLPKIRLSHPQQIEPHVGGVQTGDYIRIQGTPEVHLSIQPEIDGGIGTIAVCVNMIPHVLNAKPGLKTMLDLPVPRAIMGDVRAMVDEA
jgi:4-hydroxy-tetrahydrodipicolinate reductase